MASLFSIGRTLIFCAAGSLCLPAGAFSHEVERNIAVGGVDGFDVLANPKVSSELRSSGRVSLYVHKFIWDKTDANLHKAIGTAFRGTGPAVFEANDTSHPQAYWGALNDQFHSAGISPDMAYVNSSKVMESDLTIPQWKSYVDVARSYGFKVVAPIMTPNMGEWKSSKFADPQWDGIRERAMYGGGIAVDSPPDYFMRHPEAYQRFVEDEIVWARSQNIRATLIISPPYGGGDFLSPTKKMISKLREDGALPTDYVVENYRSAPPVGFKNVIGSEHDPMTVLGVARWLVKNTSKD